MATSILLILYFFYTSCIIAALELLKQSLFLNSRYQKKGAGATA